MDKKLNLFTKVLGKICKERGLSQAEMCRRTGMESSQMNLYFTGKASPSIDTLIKLADAIGAEPHELLMDHSATPAKELSDSEKQMEAIRILTGLSGVVLDDVLEYIQEREKTSVHLKKSK